MTIDVPYVEWDVSLLQRKIQQIDALLGVVDFVHEFRYSTFVMTTPQ